VGLAKKRIPGRSSVSPSETATGDPTLVRYAGKRGGKKPEHCSKSLNSPLRSQPLRRIHDKEACTLVGWVYVETKKIGRKIKVGFARGNEVSFGTPRLRKVVSHMNPGRGVPLR